MAVQVANEGAMVAEINRLLPATRVSYLWMAESGELLPNHHPLLVPFQLDVPLPDAAERDHGAPN